MANIYFSGHNSNSFWIYDNTNEKTKEEIYDVIITTADTGSTYSAYQVTKAPCLNSLNKLDSLLGAWWMSCPFFLDRQQKKTTRRTRLISASSKRWIESHRLPSHAYFLVRSAAAEDAAAINGWYTNWPCGWIIVVDKGMPAHWWIAEPTGARIPETTNQLNIYS